MEDIANKIKHHTDPILYPSINVKTFGLGEIVEIEIPESDNKPVFVFDKAFIRVGKNNQKLSNGAVRELIKRYTLADFDERMFHRSIQEIEFDVDAIQKINNHYYHFEKAAPVDFLKKLGLLKNHQITNAAYLCFARKVDGLSNALIKAARFKGNQPTRFIDMKDFNTNVITAVDEVLEFIVRHISMEVVLTGKSRRREIWAYPLEALREAVINAVVHRDYSDPGNIQIRIFDEKLEIWSPGLLPKEIRIDRLLSENRSIPRNRKLAEIFYSAGMIENWGTGFHRMVDACVRNENSKPQFNERSGAFVVTFLKSGQNEGVNEGVNVLLEYIRKNQGQRVPRITRALNLSPKTLERWLRKLKAYGKIMYKGSAKTGGYYIIDRAD